MNISKSVKNILQSVAEELEPKSMWKIIFPLIDEIETLQSTLEIVAEERKEYEKEAKGLKERIEQSEKNNEDTWNRVYKIRNIIKSIEDGISLDTLYENITEIGNLLNSDLSEQIELIEKINKRYIETKNIRVEKENEELKKKLSKSEDINRKLSGELLNQNEEIHLLEEEIDRLKSENEEMKEELNESRRSV